jgi:hypothetical protein
MLSLLSLSPRGRCRAATARRGRRGTHSATHGAPPTTPAGAYRETEESERTRTRAASENDKSGVWRKSPGSLRRDFCIQSPTRLRIQDRGVTL